MVVNGPRIHIFIRFPLPFFRLSFTADSSDVCCPPPGACWVNNNHKRISKLLWAFCLCCSVKTSKTPGCDCLCGILNDVQRQKGPDQSHKDTPERKCPPFSGDKCLYHLTMTCFLFRNKQNTHQSLSCDNLFMILALRSERPHLLPPTPIHNCVIHPCRRDADIAANVNAAQLVLKGRAAREARQPVGSRETYYNSDRRLDIFGVLRQ